MSDIFEDPLPGTNAPEFSVSEISGAVKRVIEGEFTHVRVRGEIGRVSRPRSGHVYLDLKDERSVLAGVVWKGVAARLATQPEEGLEVVATGRLTTFPGQSKYQIVIEEIAPAGVGALMAMLEKRKKALEAEGLFDTARKRPLPYLPEIIGVVTSPSGAVIRDILHRLRDRFPRKVLIWPVAVQGASSAPEVAAAIEGFNHLTPGGPLPRPDLLIVARGGGSIEDLWGFNEEIVARAAAASEIPLISAVGHETDTTLIDFVADVRAPTPTAAAELAVPVRAELLAWLRDQDARLTRGVTQGVDARRQRFRDLMRALPRAETLVANAAQRLDLWADRLPGALRQVIQNRRVQLSDAGGAVRPQILSSALRSHRDRLDGFAIRMVPGLARALRDRRRELAAISLRPSGIVRNTQTAREQLDRLEHRLVEIGQTRLLTERTRLSGLERLHETLGYTATLARGYAVIRAEGKVITTKQSAAKAPGLEIEFQDGRLAVGVGSAAKRKSAPKAPEQGSLF